MGRTLSFCLKIRQILSHIEKRKEQYTSYSIKVPLHIKDIVLSKGWTFLQVLFQENTHIKHSTRLKR